MLSKRIKTRASESAEKCEKVCQDGRSFLYFTLPHQCRYVRPGKSVVAAAWRNKNEREGQAMEKLERAVPVVMGLVVSISLIATAWDISFVSTLP